MPLTVCLVCNKPIITNEIIFIARRGFMDSAGWFIPNDSKNDPSWVEKTENYYIHEACARPRNPDPQALQRSMALQSTPTKG